MRTKPAEILATLGVTSESHRAVSPETWLAARKALLAREKELTHMRDQIARERLALPWVRVDKNYVFDAPEGKVTLAELFDGRSQLLVQHFMFAPGREQGCPAVPSWPTTPTA